MRNLRVTTVVFSIVVILLLAGSAFADSTVNMTFLGPGGNNSGGVYTYPYNFSINGGSPVSLICDAFNNEVYSGETWTATVTSLVSAAGMFSGQSNAALDYKAAGLIFQSILAGNIDPNAGNWAIWGLFSDLTNNSYFENSNALSIESTYLALAATASDSMFNGLVVYDPNPGSQPNGLGVPQEYIGYAQPVPEPGMVTLLITAALCGLLGMVFRKQLKSKLAVAL